MDFQSASNLSVYTTIELNNSRSQLHGIDPTPRPILTTHEENFSRDEKANAIENP